MPNDVDVRSYTATFVDRDSEKSTTGVRNKTFADLAAYEAARDDFEASLSAITNGTRYKRSEALNTLLASQSAPSNNSFREDKWLVRIEDNTTFKRSSFTIPTADPSTITFVAGTDNIDLSVGAGATAKANIEAFVESPDGNAITVLSIEYVGRNI